MSSFLKTTLWSLGLTLCSGATLQAQSANEIYLNAYTVPLNQPGAVIANVYNKTGKADRAVLEKDTSGLFTIGKGGRLSLKKGAKLTAGEGFSYEVTIRSGNSSAAFILVKDEFIHNKVVAHRGAWKNQPGSQNSLSSLKDAIRLGCEGSEFDVWLSSDAEIVLSHDPVIGGKVVEETPLAELTAIPLKNGDYVPTLKAYIETAMVQNKTRLVLELKPSKKGRGQELATKAVAMVHAMKAQAWVDYISFDYEILKKIKELDPLARSAYLNGDKTPAALREDGIWGLDYNQSLFKKDPQLISEARKNKVTTNCWTVDDPAYMEQLLKDQVDFITTNEPEILLEKVKK